MDNLSLTVFFINHGCILPHSYYSKMFSCLLNIPLFIFAYVTRYFCLTPMLLTFHHVTPMLLTFHRPANMLLTFHHVTPMLLTFLRPATMLLTFLRLTPILPTFLRLTLMLLTFHRITPMLLTFHNFTPVLLTFFHLTPMLLTYHPVLLFTIPGNTVPNRPSQVVASLVGDVRCLSLFTGTRCAVYWRCASRTGGLSR